MPFAELRRHLVALERWALPAECLLCQSPLGGNPQDPLVCPACRLRWRPVPHPQCRRCGQPVSRELECRICTEWPAGLGDVQSAVWLDGTARNLVHLLKYEGWWRAVEAMAYSMLRLAPLTRPGVLAPVPLAPSRQRIRGYNQADRLARELGRRTGLPVRPELLLRRRDTPTQTALTPEARRANVAGAFAARGVRGRRVILVDDVFTTGATLAACAEALGEAGASEVGAVTFARAVLPVR